MGADDEDDDDALTWVDYLSDQPGLTAFAFLREPARTQERPRRHCISPRSALARSQARKHARMYVRSRSERHNARTHPRTHTYAHLNAVLGSSVEATNTLQRINRITAPPGIRSPPFCHDDVCTWIYARSSRYENHAASRRSSWTATRKSSSLDGGTPREKLKETYSGKLATDRGLPDAFFLILAPLQFFYPSITDDFSDLLLFFPVLFSLPPRIPSLSLSFFLSNYYSFLYFAHPSPSTLSPFFSHPPPGLLFF